MESSLCLTMQRGLNSWSNNSKQKLGFLSKVKGLSFKPSGDYIVAPNLCFWPHCETEGVKVAKKGMLNEHYTFFIVMLTYDFYLFQSSLEKNCFSKLWWLLCALFFNLQNFCTNSVLSCIIPKLFKSQLRLKGFVKKNLLRLYFL